MNKLSSAVIIEKTPNELNIGETKILSPVYKNVELTKNSLSTSSSSKDILDDFDLEVAIDKT